MSYDHKHVDKKWQDRWEKAEVFHAEDFSKKEKEYILVEFPYPSGAGLHMGHPRSYTALDVIARKHRMQGKNVLYPIGWDAFGLPTENYAIKTGKKPQEVTKQNIETFRRQLQSLGISFDWSREINTTDPEYYKWTQWQFIQFFNEGLAYKKNLPINWCSSCKIGLANEEVVGGVCERCGNNVEKRDKEQWMLAITKYADRLIDDLATVNYLPKIKKQQIDWIGRSEGAEIVFNIIDHDDQIKVFTTRPDTIFGATYMVLAPEHPLVEKITTKDQLSAIKKYIKKARVKTDIERGDDSQKKTGVFTGVFAKNPATGEKIPIWIADYVLMNYGTGAIMAVPAHDERDFAFATVHKLSIIKVILPPVLGSVSSGVGNQAGGKMLEDLRVESDVFLGEGDMVNSGEFDGMESVKAKEKITKWLEKKKIGKKTVNYKLRDWVFSRQRYWGEPIPLVHCEGSCSVKTGGWMAVPDDQLPVLLPDVEKYEPTDSGESPLAEIEDWVNTKCPNCNGPAKRETDTMPNWAGSSWYFLRYIDPHNADAFASAKKLQYWMPVDLYNGGMEHTTLHLLYSRFWHKFLFDQKLVPTPEPYARRHSHGLILAADGTKMSKSKGNGVNPDEVVERVGADALRVYQMFIGPFEEPVPWSDQGLVGVRRFLEKVVKLSDIVSDKESEAVTRSLHQTIKKVSSDVDSFGFNTAVAQMMTFVNVVTKEKQITKESFLKFLMILNPFAPHITNEIAEGLGVSDMLEMQEWPRHDDALAAESEIHIAVQVNGKLRGTIIVEAGVSEEDVVKLARENENVVKHLADEPKKTIYVKDRLVNFVL